MFSSVHNMFGGTIFVDLSLKCNLYVNMVQGRHVLMFGVVHKLANECLLVYNFTFKSNLQKLQTLVHTKIVIRK